MGQMNLFGGGHSPSADKNRSHPDEIVKKDWLFCWRDCALCEPTLYLHSSPNKKYRVYRLCRPFGAEAQKCFEPSLCCDLMVPKKKKSQVLEDY